MAGRINKRSFTPASLPIDPAASSLDSVNSVDSATSDFQLSTHRAGGFGTLVQVAISVSQNSRPKKFWNTLNFKICAMETVGAFR
jgi:hypothetical protein